MYAFSEVAKAIARHIALALDLESNFFYQQKMLGKPIATLRLLHYEGLTSDPTKGLYGASAYSGFGLITLLATDDVAGLQICKHKDAKPQIWEHVVPLKGWDDIASTFGEWSKIFCNFFSFQVGAHKLNIYEGLKIINVHVKFTTFPKHIHLLAAKVQLEILQVTMPMRHVLTA
ncbi:unnamed protein product [Ilex paraguariensis]|uniref:Uncharacterized protein n=1 Tax=Ilex paraguariensis TaxID=185542 RepID=A0ABC8RLZ3_9AQUA